MSGTSAINECSKCGRTLEIGHTHQCALDSGRTGGSPDYTTQSISVCGKCGVSYPTFSAHICRMDFGQASSPQYYQWPMPIVSIDGETKQLLERIAVALEKTTSERQCEVKHPINMNGDEDVKRNYCYNCGTSVKDQKYCHGCGGKLLWNKGE